MLALRFTHNLLLFKAGYHLGLLSGNRGPLYFCQLAGDRQISVGATRSQTDEEVRFELAIIGVGIEHIDPAQLLEISQGTTNCEPVEQIHDIAATDLAAVLGVTVRQARNVRKTLSECEITSV
jgi:hypothetical protein